MSEAPARHAGGGLPRHGVVYVVETFVELPPSPRFWGHWERLDPADTVVTGPGWSSAEDAIRWGRARAPAVLIRTLTDSGRSRYWSAGALRRERLHGAAVPVWPERLDHGGEARHRLYGGVVWLAEEGPTSAGGELALRWQSGLGEGACPELYETASATDLDEAIEWARARARCVILRFDPPPHVYYSAGDVDPPGMELARWGEEHGGWTSIVE